MCVYPFGLMVTQHSTTIQFVMEFYGKTHQTYNSVIQVPQQITNGMATLKSTTVEAYAGNVKIEAELGVWLGIFFLFCSSARFHA